MTLNLLLNLTSTVVIVLWAVHLFTFLIQHILAVKEILWANRNKFLLKCDMMKIKLSREKWCWG